MMPEGPEVRLVTEGIRKRLLDRSIVSADILSGRYTKKTPEGWCALEIPITVTNVGCKGKFIYISFGEHLHLFNTLGMTGGWSDKRQKHSRVEFLLDDGSRVYFNDVRNFGTLKFVSSKKYLENKLSTLGPDMLAEDVSDDTFAIRMKRCLNDTVAEVLMNQSVICGVGNYLKSESLYFAKISPHRSVASLSNEDLVKLNKVIKSVIRKSYETGGATIYTFQGFNGEKGEYTRRFAVYNQASDPSGKKVESFTSPDGRTTYWVPEEQT
jgi:formamidopyrimidine-DNA glycosylase